MKLTGMKFLLFVVLLMGVSLAEAQQISVKSFRKLENDLSARTEKRVDQNGDVCAIIKVVAPEQGFYFDGDGNGIVAVERKIGEYWVYVPYGSRYLTVKHDKLGILRAYAYDVRIDKACVYEMVLTTGKVVTTVENAITEQWLVIHVEPKEAMVYIDDVYEAATEGVVQKYMKYGQYHYRVTAPLYQTEAGTVEVKADKKAELTVQLKPAFGYLNITSQPEAGARVWIDEEEVGVTPFKSGRLKEGKHLLKVSKNFFHPVEKEVNLSAGATESIPFVMQAAYGFIQVNSQPETGADVYIDGVKVGKTPFKSERLKSGEYRVQVVCSMYQPVEQLVTVADNQTATVEAGLSANFASVTVTTDLDAELWVNNELKGKGKWSGRLSGGVCVMEARRPSHRTVRKSLELQAGETKTVTLEAPQPIYGALNISSNPTGAEIRINGKVYGNTPMVLPKVLIGECRIEIGKEGYNTYVRELDIAEGKMEEVKAELEIFRFTAAELNAKGDSAVLLKKYNEAADFYRQACERGDGRGYYNLALMYKNGWGVGRDTAQAKLLFKRALDAGDENAWRANGILFQRGQWVKKAALPFSAGYGGISFVFGTKIYVGGRYGTSFWEYDTEQDKWSQKGKLPQEIYAPVFFVIGNRGYMGAASGYKGSRKFWEYNPETDTWTAKRDFKGNISYNTYGFAYQGKGYVGEKKKDKWWEYDPQTDQWTEKGEEPGGYYGFSNGEKAYILNRNSLYECDPVAIKNTVLPDYPGATTNLSGCATPLCLYLSGYITGKSRSFYSFDLNTKQWQALPQAEFQKSDCICAGSGNKLYVFDGGKEQYTWEYDPSEILLLENTGSRTVKTSTNQQQTTGQGRKKVSSGSVNTTTATSGNKTYKIGDIYEIGGMKGMVYRVEGGGQHGWAISLNRVSDISWGGAKQWCEGKGWRLPTLEEIKFLYSIKNAINTLFSHRGGSPLNNIYWTSTAYGGGLIYTCSFYTGVCNGGNKDSKRAVFAVYKF